jgi:hypothetical protein
MQNGEKEGKKTRKKLFLSDDKYSKVNGDRRLSTIFQAEE